MEMLRKYICVHVFILSISISQVFAQDTCLSCESTPQVHTRPLPENQFDMLYRLAGRAPAIEERCSFPFMSQKKHEDKDTVTVTIQMGFIDHESQAPNQSSDRQIIKAIMESFEEKCDFTSSDSHEFTLERKGRDGRTLKIVLLPSSPNGFYNKEFTKTVEAKFQTSLSQSDYLVTIGHSRLGKGLDLHPLKFSKPLPVYTSHFIRNLPSTLSGMANLACDSTTYANKQGASGEARKRNLRLITLDDELFPFSQSVQELYKSLRKF